MTQRSIRKSTPEERAELQQVAALIETEKPEINEYFRRAKRAAEEPTLSGELRRAIHSIHQRGISLDALEERAKVDWATLEPFMIGEAPLPSDVIDRLATVLGLHLQSVAVEEAVGSTARE